MKKILSVMKFACDCLVAFVMRREESFLEPEVSSEAEALAVIENRSDDKQIPWAGIAAGVAVGLTALTAVAMLKKGKKKR